MKQRIYLKKLSPQDFESFLENKKLHLSFDSFKVLEVNSSKLLGFAKLEINELDGLPNELFGRQFHT